MPRLLLILALLSLPSLAFGQYGSLGGNTGGTGYGPVFTQPATTPGYNATASTPSVSGPARSADLSRRGPSNRRNTSLGGVFENVVNDPRLNRRTRGMDNCTPSRRQISGGPMVFVGRR